MKKRYFLISAMALALIGSSAWAVPQQINYQGKLTDSVGTPITTPVTIKFSIYNVSSGGTELWSSTRTIDPDDAGIYDVILGELTSINLVFDEPYFLGVKVDTDSEMTPRLELSSVGYAYTADNADNAANAANAANADKLDGQTLADLDSRYINTGQTGSISTSMLQNSSVSSVSVADNSLTASDLGVNSVGASEIAPGAVTASEIATGAVASVEVLDNSLTAADLATGSVGSSEVINNSLTAADLATGSVGSSEVIDNSLTAADLATGSVGSSEVADNSLTAADLAPNSVYAGEIAASAVGSSEIADHTIIAVDLSTDLYDDFVNVTGDDMTGNLDVTAYFGGHAALRGADESAANEYATGYLGFYQPSSSSLGLTYSPLNIGVLGVKFNVGAEGVGVYAWNNDDSTINYSMYSVADGNGTSATNYGIYATAENANINYGGYFNGSGAGPTYGIRINSTSSGSTSYGIRTYSTSSAGTIYGIYNTVSGPTGNDNAVYGFRNSAYAHGTNNLRGSYNYAYHYGTTTGTTYGTQSYGYGSDTGTAYGVYAYGANSAINYGLYAYSGSGTTSYGVYATGSGSSGIGIRAYGGSGYAADFYGKVRIRSTSGTTVMELGEGLDYAEGFNVTNEERILSGSVLVIDPDNPGHLKLSDSAYDTKVAGIVAGANGIGTGVRLGADQFDKDVALAGRVYCNVDAGKIGIKTGDLLTTSSIPGYAMKADNYGRSQGAILGKAMESIEQGKKGQILVLVTLQ